MTGRNILLMFVFTLTPLYGRFNPMIFLLRVLLGGGVNVNSIFSLKPQIVSALLCAGAALSKYSLLQDISDLLLLTCDGICWEIVGGWFDCLLMQSSWLLVVIFLVLIIFVSS